ncbi:MAG TPA: hypothetical protein EYG54_09845 [Myxococcales bacterium]|nr:hypothetical protein [Myxococcales bacterium]
MREQRNRFLFWTATVTAIGLLSAASAAGSALNVVFCLAAGGTHSALEVKPGNGCLQVDQRLQQADFATFSAPAQSTDAFHPHSICVDASLAPESAVRSQGLRNRLSPAAVFTPFAVHRLGADINPWNLQPQETPEKNPRSALSTRNNVVLRC